MNYLHLNAKGQVGESKLSSITGITDPDLQRPDRPSQGEETLASQLSRSAASGCGRKIKKEKITEKKDYRFAEPMISSKSILLKSSGSFKPHCRSRTQYWITLVVGFNGCSRCTPLTQPEVLTLSAVGSDRLTSLRIRCRDL